MREEGTLRVSKVERSGEVALELSFESTLFPGKHSVHYITEDAAVGLVEHILLIFPNVQNDISQLIHKLWLFPPKEMTITKVVQNDDIEIDEQ